MRYLIIFAHPRPDSFSAALRHAVVDTLAGKGHQIDLLDLNDSGFDPVLSADARNTYFDPQRNCAGIEQHVARLKRAEAIVLIYPNWWFGFPAVLKGYFDRVWVPGVAFELGRFGLSGRLDNIVKFIVITSYGSAWWYARFVVRDPTQRLITHVFAALCHPACRTLYLALFRMDNSGEKRRRRFLDRVRRRIARF
jgi:NAD(P)H dehydrogenase (quinone)